MCHSTIVYTAGRKQSHGHGVVFKSAANLWPLPQVRVYYQLNLTPRCHGNLYFFCLATTNGHHSRSSLDRRVKVDLD